MNFLTQLGLLHPSRAFRRAATIESQQADIPLDIKDLWPEIKQAYDILPPAKKSHGKGVRLLLEYGRWNLALYQTLLEHNIEKPEALDLVEKIQWHITEPSSASFYKISKLRSRSMPKRIRWIMDTSFKVLFTHPFERDVYESKQGTEFNVTRCPFAEYMAEQNASSDFTSAVFCSMDARMAK